MNGVVDDGDAAQAISKRRSNTNHCGAIAFPRDLAAPYGAGSARPLDGGDAPVGYTVKGNSTSMKYHTPEGQWYEQTVADVWFDGVESAEAAGFVEAGSAASIEANEEKDEGADK